MTNPAIGAPSRPIRDGDHSSILATLPEYVMIRVLEQQATGEWQVLEQHLSACSACRGEVDALMRLMTATYTGTVPPVAAPVPRLAFLQDRSMPMSLLLPGKQLRPDELWNVAIQFSPALLQSIRVPMAARSRANQLRYHFERPSSGGGEPSITVEVFVDDDAPDHGRVRVCVESPEGNPFDQPNSRVVLQVEEISWSAITDRNGLAVFPDVSLAQIDRWHFTVTPLEEN